jgi:crotonobetainyl-CoA:carnitine CoA-transferase CaiB-like acyl-CoA transferase
VLADLGAEVIKVERPGAGDDTRHWGPPFLGQFSAYFLSVNRGKRSVAIDLNQPAGRQVVDELIARCDVLLENFLPHTAATFGLTAERLAQLNPELVVCSISGFGRTGPCRDVPGYDFVIQALSGLMSITGEPDGEPMKVGVAIADVLTGLYAAVSVLAGLVRRHRLRRGCHFDLALLDCTVASLVNVVQGHLITGRSPERYGNAHPHIVPYQCFRTADGYLVLAVGNDRQWQRFCRAVDRDDWAGDPSYATNPARVEHREQLVAEIAPLMAARPTAEWIDRLSEHEVPHAPVLGLSEVVAQAQVRARGMVHSSHTPAGDRFETIASPIRGTGPNAPPAPHTSPLPPPALGEHTDEVLAELLNYDAEKLRALRESGAIE